MNEQKQWRCEVRKEVMKEKVMMWIAWKMPKWLVYFCAIRLGANATTGKHGSQIVPDLNFMDALKRWSK